MTIIRLTTIAMLSVAMIAPLGAQVPVPAPAPDARPLPNGVPAVPPVPVAPDTPAVPFVFAPQAAPMPFPHLVVPTPAFHFDDADLFQKSFAVVHVDTTDRTYQQARTAIEQQRYDRALTLLDQVIAAKGDEADAATYWKAYSEARVGRRADALTTIAEFQKEFPRSRWLNDARFLDVEIRQASGQAVQADALANEELKLLALRGLIRNDAESAVPVIEGILSGTSSPRVKDQALFVLSQNRTPRTRGIILGVAKGNANPELQLKAIRYLGMMGGMESADALGEVYRASADQDVKRAILRSYAAAGARDQLLSLAKSEASVDLRAEAVQQLGALRAATALADLYRSDQAPEVKRAVVNALAGQRDAATLVSLARGERDLELKKAIVSRLSTMPSREARDYMMELLK